MFSSYISRSYILFAAGVVALLSIGSFAEAAYTLKDGKLMHKELVPTMSVQDHYSAGLHALEVKEWGQATRQFDIVINNFPYSEFYEDAIFYLGVSQYYQKEYDVANKTLSHYLGAHKGQAHFEQAIQYKFAIAEQFREGAKRRLFGWKTAPKWSSGRDMALSIYDEVIAAMPGSELAAKSLYGKGSLLQMLKEYRESIESYQLIIRRFPKAPLAADAYLAVLRVYLEESKEQFQSPDLLELAQVSLHRFTQDFPRDERLTEAQEVVTVMEEHFAGGWYETGRFYERVKQPEASRIYYLKTVRDFPHTKAAIKSSERLDIIAHKIGAQKAPEQESISHS